MKALTPILLVLLAIFGFFFFVKPTYGELNALRAQAAQAQDTLNKTQQAQGRYTQLVNTLNSISSADLDRLNKTLPDSLDTLRYLVDLTNFATAHKTTLNSISFQVNTGSDSGDSSSGTGKTFNSSAIHFSVTMTYPAFIVFMQDLEHDMRITDITSVSFKPTVNGIYQFQVAIRTYWLK